MLGAAEVAAFLTHLAVERRVAPSTRSQAKPALLFLYRGVLRVELRWLDEVVAAKPSRRLPVVLTPAEMRVLLHGLSGPTGLKAVFFDGTGIRRLEGLRLRVKDFEFERRELLARDGKGTRTGHRAARKPGVAAAAATRAGQRAACTGSCRRLRRGPAAARAGFVTHRLRAGDDIRTVQELPGHADASTTMIYAHVMNRGGRGVRSPLDPI